MKRRLVVLAVWPLLSCSLVIGPERAKDSQALFDELWGEFDRHYSFFELKGIDWAAVRAQHLPQLKGANNTALLNEIAAALKVLDDVHVDLIAPGIVIRSAPQRAFRSTSFSSQTVFSMYVTFVGNTAHMRFGKTAQRIGYVFIPSFGGDGWGSEIDVALQRLGDISGLVLDIRNNQGGNDGNGVEIAGRFTTQPRLFEYFQFRNGPHHSDFSKLLGREIRPLGTPFAGGVVVLTNRQDFSSSETFVLMMRSIPGVQIIGDTTGGGSSNPLARELSNGWTYRISEGINYGPDTVTFENIGLAPSIIVPQTAADSTARVDRQLERAIQQLSTAPITVTQRGRRG
jgi:carboxyl-terminal processing protease